VSALQTRPGRKVVAGWRRSGKISLEHCLLAPLLPVAFRVLVLVDLES
jgi:hypothetical protein